MSKMSVKERLVEWALWRHNPPTINPMPENRTLKERAIKVDTSVHGDGGMISAVQIEGQAIEIDERAREVQRALKTMPEDYRQLIDAVYATGNPRDIPRPHDVACHIAGFRSERTFGYYLGRAEGWLENELLIFAVKKPADGVGKKSGRGRKKSDKKAAA